MKKILIVLGIIVIVAFAIQAILNKQNKEDININDLGIIKSATIEDAISKLVGKPTVVFIVGTFCPHCQSAMPEYKTEIWDVYKNNINIFANVIDGVGGKRFDVSDIPQGVDAQLSFENLTGESCEFVPSWVLLDAEGNTVDSSCGAKKGIDVIKNGIDNLLNSVELSL
jgi:thiol-disulfide isomerase/thioredoxin